MKTYTVTMKTYTVTIKTYTVTMKTYSQKVLGYVSLHQCLARSDIIRVP